MSDKRVLVVDDEASQREIIARILKSDGWEVDTAESAEAARRHLDPLPDVVLTDLKMAGKDGLELLGELKKVSPDLPVVLMTAHGTVDTAVRAMKAGAADYLTKPLSRDELLIVLDRTLERGRLVKQNAELTAALDRQAAPENVIAEHGAMRDVLKLVAKVAPSTSTVMVYGETGTGKELIARAIHHASRRKDGPFVPVNAAAIPAALLEAELFGHEKGAFTGASARRIGLVERAARGTLFLDEIGDLPLELQPKLLRVLQEREIMRVGGAGPIAVDVRIVAATHRDLAEMCADGKFRDDLYWRLNVFPIVLPPLRARASDIPRLAEHFLAQLSAREGTKPKRLSREVVDLLVAQRWPGNVRQLQAVIERASLLAEGDEIQPGDLPPEMRAPPSQVMLSPAVQFTLPDEGFVFEDFEKELLAQAMARSGGVVARAAKMVGMSYRTLQYRLDKFGLRGGSTGAGPDPATAPETPES